MKDNIGFYLFMGVVAFVVACLGTFFLLALPFFGLEVGLWLALKVGFWAAVSVLILSVVMDCRGRDISDAAALCIVGGLLGGAVALVVLLAGFSLSAWELPADSVVLILALTGNGLGFLFGLMIWWLGRSVDKVTTT